MLSEEQDSVLGIMMGLISNNGIGRLPTYMRKHFVYRVGGYAGTGKTHLLCELRRELNISNKKINIAYATFTGKASSVLKTKLLENNALMDNDYIGTIHGLIYKPRFRYDRKLRTNVIIGWKLIHTDEFYYDLIIIDEGSMISYEIWQDIKKFSSIIIVGDHGQLPPISEKTFSLMTNPNFILKKIHRQSEDNPIIQLSAFVRKHGYIPSNNVWAPGVFKIPWGHKKTQEIWNNNKHDENSIVICGFNMTRCYINDEIRKQMDHKKKLPYPGERIICLRNNHKIKLMNGQIGTLIWIMPEDKNLYRLTILVDGDIEPYECMSNMSSFGQVTYTVYKKDQKTKESVKHAISKGYEMDYFDYGYCISVHKSQGSEWDRVILIEQRTQRWDNEYYKRWLYTGITRAKEKLMIISDFY